MNLDQVPAFADYVTYLLGIVGDGINLDFEHMSEGTPEERARQLKVMAHLLHYTRKSLKDAKL